MADRLKHAKIVADGTAVAGPCVVYGVVYRTLAVAGAAFELRDNGVAGAVKFEVDTDAVVTVRTHMLDQGIVFDTDVYVNLVQSNSVTVIYEDA